MCDPCMPPGGVRLLACECLLYCVMCAILDLRGYQLQSGQDWITIRGPSGCRLLLAIVHDGDNNSRCELIVCRYGWEGGMRTWDTDDGPTAMWAGPDVIGFL